MSVQVDVYTTTTISGASDNGSGLVRLTVRDATQFRTGQTVTVAGVVGTTEANGTWTVTYINSTTLDLQSSAFVNTYTSGGTVTTGNGNWTKPSWATLIRVVCIGGGGGGGGGGSGASTTAISGGGGGGGASLNETWFLASDLGSTEPYAVGVGGSAGAVGAQGTTGGISSFGGNVLSAVVYGYAGGGGGAGGINNAGAGGSAGLAGSGGQGASVSGSAGANGGITSGIAQTRGNGGLGGISVPANTAAAAGGQATLGGAAGGGGGPKNATPVYGPGGNGGRNLSSWVDAPPAGVNAGPVDGTAGGTGLLGYAGGGGSGGAAHVTLAGNGGAGGFPGGGGGGGGATVTGGTAGVGGAGGSGVVIVWSY